MIPRLLGKILKDSPKGLLLLGPRQTGKSTLIHTLSPDLTINLMNESTYLDFASHPSMLEELLAAKAPNTVFIDEIQRLPSLLNTIQTIIDESPDAPRFLLSGSSARKLRRGAANLLPGRLFTYRLGPICAAELGYEANPRALQYGSLPEALTLDNANHVEKLLLSYTGTYLKEEIQAEALAKSIEGFARFLRIAAAESTRYLDLAKLSQQAQIDRSSAVRWFEILEDTLLVYRVDAYAKSDRKRLVQHPRFFFFDNGVLNALLKNFSASPDRIGVLFENLFCSQLMASAFARDAEIDVHSYRTSHGAEVDFVVEIGSNLYAIECKATVNRPRFSTAGFDSLASLTGRPVRKILAYLGSEALQIDDVSVLPWQHALRELGL